MRMMKWLGIIITLAFITVAGSGACIARRAFQDDVWRTTISVAPKRVVVKFRPGVPAHAQASVVTGRGHATGRTIPQLEMHVVLIPPGRTAEDVVARYENHPLVEFAEADQVVEPALIPDDPWYHVSVNNQWHLPAIDGPAAWDITTGSSDVIIAILDTGVDGTHPELQSKMVPGWNVINDNSDTHDVNGHGTRVAGTVAAISNNGTLVASVCWGAKIMPIRVASEFGTSSGTLLAAGLVWAADHGARVANMSLAMVHSETVRAAAQYFQDHARGIVTMSAGNFGFVDSNPDDPFIITVSATDKSDQVTDWSVTGNPIDVSAPGVAIITIKHDDHAWVTSASGTSHSAPIVAGVAALVLSVNPNLGAHEVEEILQKSADDFGPKGWDPDYGWGRINLAQAVRSAGGVEPPPPPRPDTEPPTVSIAFPGDGDVVSGPIAVLVNANDNAGISAVDLFLDDRHVSKDATPPYRWPLDTVPLADGEHMLFAMATDTSDNTATSDRVIVTVSNTPPPEPEPIIETFDGSVNKRHPSQIHRVTINADGQMSAVLTFGGKRSSVRLSLLGITGNMIYSRRSASPLHVENVGVQPGPYQWVVQRDSRNVGYSLEVTHP